MIGTAKTDAGGQWHLVTPPASSGKYYAKATKKATSKFICKPAKSDTLKVSAAFRHDRSAFRGPLRRGRGR